MKLIIFLDSDSELYSFHTKINVTFSEAKFTGNIYVGKVVQYSEKKIDLVRRSRFMSLTRL